MNGGVGIMRVFAFTGGGTGGHIYPGLAVAAALTDICGCRIIWLGSKNNSDRFIVESAGIEFKEISSGKLRRYFSLKNFTDIFLIIAGFFSSLFFLKKNKPLLLFSKGGFVSVPPAAAAFTLGIPVFTHESDFSPGLATRINAVFAKKIFVAYEQTGSFFAKKYLHKIMLSGNPVRAEFYSANPENGRSFFNIPAGERILLVLGGSQGAKEINDLIEACIDGLTKYFFVVHQTGIKQEGKAPCDSAEKYTRRYIRIPYIMNEMPDILAAAELVAGRAGAGTVWECAAAGRPMVLVPLSGNATRGDQIENAKFFEERGAACVLIRPSAKEFAALLDDLAKDSGRLTAMASASEHIGTLRGAPVIARQILEEAAEEKLYP
ncbi:MAG: undecaprenyldiphospho-muramoylpentapeptide beta-N-acetylglucosaminyltransferase [Spirochaetaceae bacterium]|jgi:UDP-N-acetylglucosamine--N-acetylmuramyl-(pentapeptide) pyrophosphoryl-undecaprenol N-acetylglucosamine transferase|nr:undecaprenyldiphospho-muramoylpentapeptide beta-N-acetylglucosaminyltransferase [Spirochaetaceae bacterium]